MSSFFQIQAIMCPELQRFVSLQAGSEREAVIMMKSCSITACLDVCPAITLSSIIWSSVDELPLPWSLEYVHKLFLTLLNKFLLSISSTSVDFFWVMLYSFTMKWIILGFKMNDLIYFIVQTSGVGKKLILLFSYNEFNWSKVRVRLL